MVNGAPTTATSLEQSATISVKDEVLIRPARRAALFSMLVSAAFLAPTLMDRLG
jgi:hypothetical protein